jgi:hypothetical protein
VKHFSFWTMFSTVFFAFASMAEEANPAIEMQVEKKM